jgi:hypothetical protein
MQSSYGKIFRVRKSKSTGRRRKEHYQRRAMQFSFALGRKAP